MIRSKPGPKGPRKWTEKRVKTLVKKIMAYCREAQQRSVEVIPGDDGKFKVLGPKLPTIQECLKKNSVSSSTVYGLKEKHPRLAEALKKLQDISEMTLINMTLQGAYNSTFAIFAAKNMFKWRDEQSPLVDQSQHTYVAQVTVQELKKLEMGDLVERARNFIPQRS